MYEDPGGSARPSTDGAQVAQSEAVGRVSALAMAPPAPRGISPTVLRCLGGVAIAVLTLGLGYLAARFASSLADLAAYGYAGVFGVMVVTGGSIFFPIPGTATVFAAGMVWNPFLVGLAAGLGNSIGELTGYLAGRSGRALINPSERPFFVRADRYLRRFGFPALVVFAAIPNPVFDAVGIAAGCLGYSVTRFWLAAAIGNVIKYTAFALIGGFASSLL